MARRINRNPLRKIVDHDADYHYLECGHWVHLEDNPGASHRRCWRCGRTQQEKEHGQEGEDKSVPDL